MNMLNQYDTIPVPWSCIVEVTFFGMYNISNFYVINVLPNVVLSASSSEAFTSRNHFFFSFFFFCLQTLMDCGEV